MPYASKHKRNKNGSFSELQRQRQESIENNNDDQMQILKNGEVRYGLRKFSRYWKEVRVSLERRY